MSGYDGSYEDSYERDERLRRNTRRFAIRVEAAIDQLHAATRDVGEAVAECRRFSAETADANRKFSESLKSMGKPLE